MTLPAPLQATLAVIEVLDALRVRYFLGGSFASSAQGAARATLDADIIADLRPEHIAPFIAALRETFYLDADTVQRAVERLDSFNVIHLASMFKVDLFVHKGKPFSESQFARRRLAQLFHDPPTFVYLSSPEDTILAKLDWYRRGGAVSDRQWNDILSVLQVQRGRFEMDYLRKWAADLGLSDLLAAALEQVGR